LLNNNIRSCVVVGGGISGLTSALRLSQLGVRVKIIEKEKDVGGLARSCYDPHTKRYREHAFHAMGGHYLEYF
jgi:protoporphyrinogen oxidase